MQTTQLSPDLLRLNPAIDVAALHEQFRRDGRIQVRDLLDAGAAARLTGILKERTPWGLTWQAAANGPHRISPAQMRSLAPQQAASVGQSLADAVRQGQFAFVYSQYCLSDEAHAGRSATADHDQLVKELNGQAFLDFVRAVTGVPEITCCDAQLTHFGPGHFLTLHEDVNATENDYRLVAYVLNLCDRPWHPDWGGYLNFFDEAGDIVHGYRPRFNSLNMFKVPRPHNVSFMTPHAPEGRLAVTGWFRSR